MPCSGGVCYPNMPCSGGQGGACSQGVPGLGGSALGGAWGWEGSGPGGMPGGDPPDGYCCGRNASYWNAFLFWFYRFIKILETLCQ